MARPRALTSGQIKAARKLNAGGASWSMIAQTLCVGVDRLRRLADPAFRARRNENKVDRDRCRKQGVRVDRSSSWEPPIPPRPVETPPDTLVGRLMGDPPLERSALAMKRQMR